MGSYSVWLFDIDGVLVRPQGYRASVRATLNHFFRQMRLPDRLLPDENVIAGFEAIRITSEWDMVPICLAGVLDTWLSANPGFRLSEELPEAIQQIGNAFGTASLPLEIDYQRIQRVLKGNLRVGEYPADTVLSLARSDQSPLLFPRLAGHRLLKNLLTGSRDLDYSLTTRIFQHYTLGSQDFYTCYQRPPEFHTESLLASLDQPLLQQSYSREIKRLKAQGLISPAAFTLRPSLPPRGETGNLSEYFAPEAEIALQLVQLEHIPLIGYGRILYLARQLGLETEILLKPSPVQAIAAILAAISGDEIKSLLAAWNIYAKDTLPPDTNLYPGDRLKVHVFEDSAGGMEAVLAAASILRKYGLTVETVCYGLADHPEKMAALLQIGASIFSSTSQAVQHALESLNAE